jgi:hypothetical protein
LSSTTSSSVTGTLTSSSPIWASVASPDTGTRSTLTSSCLTGTSILSRSVRHALADPHGAGLALAGAGPELFLAPLHPQLVLIVEVIAPTLGYALVVAVVLAKLAGLGVAHGHARADGAGGLGAGRPRAAVLVAIVVAVRPAPFGGPGTREPVVGTYLLLVLGGYLVVVVKVRPVLHRALGLRDRQALALLVGRDEVHGDEGAAGAEEAHFDADVFGLVVLVDEQVVYLADLVAVLVVDGVPRVTVLDRREPVSTLFRSNSFPPRLKVRCVAFVSTLLIPLSVLKRQPPFRIRDLGLRPRQVRGYITPPPVFGVSLTLRQEPNRNRCRFPI